MSAPPEKHRATSRFLPTAAVVVFVILPCACASLLWFVFIMPAIAEAEMFDLSRLASPELPPDAFHQAIPIRDVSPHVIHALISREDPRFLQHAGIDYVATAREFWRHGQNRPTQGARTITQQLALISFDLSRYSNRHLLLLALARRIERNLTKNQILECYLNRVFFGTVDGKPVHGIEAASLAYFGEKASALRLEDGAMLIGLIRSPTRLSPYHDAGAALVARNEVLRRMAEDRWITNEELGLALQEPLHVKRPSSESVAP
jgi:penicillin-binding protein 1A